jgi:two-component system CheB/CheR fusion protein
LFQAQQESLQARLFNENLLLNLPVGVVVVDRRYDIREINSAARRLLGIHTVAIGEDLLHLAQNVSNKDFRSAIDKAFRENTVTQLSEVQVPQMTTGEPAYLRIECYPRPHGQNDSGEAGGEGGEEDGPVESVLVLIVEVTEMVQSRREVEQGAALLSARAEELRVANAALAANNEEMRGTNVALEEAHRKAKEVAARHAQQIEVLAEENRKLIAANQEVAARHAQQIEVLAEANRDLLTANQEVTRANSELRTTLDEFLVANEESQAAVEEVETLNEEMQATNEELETLNEEMQATVEELNTSNSDLQARGDELQSLASLLEVQKAQLEAILSGLADAVLVVTQEGKPLLMNEAYKRLFGSGENGEEGENKEADLFNDGADGDGRPARMEDENFRPLLPGETPQSRATRGETFRMTFTLASPLGGERRWLEAIGQPVHGEGGQEWGVVVVRDITERSLRIMQEQFTALAGHELRTPLTSIKGYLHLLDKSLKENGSERQVKHVQIAITQSERLMRLIEDLLDVARLQTGKFSLRQEPLRLDTLLEQAVASAQVLAKGQKIELIVDDRVPAATAAASAHNGDGDSDASDAGGPLLVNGDAARLEQAVLNLLTNAITYAPDSARIDVRLCRVDGTAVDGTPVAVAEIHVQDNGKGIAAKDLSEVFTRFYQVSKGNPLPAQGLGLGLFITREIVEAHGGTISVISAEGKGATFIIRLPLFAQKPEKRADADAHARTDGTA